MEKKAIKGGEFLIRETEANEIFTPEDFKKRLEESGVDYILIARGAIGNPYIFKQINDYMKT